VIHETFSVEGACDVDVRFEAGRVEVHRGGAGTVDIKVETKLPGFIVEQRGNSILVSSDTDDHSWLSVGSAHVVIEAPDGTDLRVGVASAPVYATVALGKVEIKTASGDVEIEKAETLFVKTASGDVNVGTVERALRYTSASGDLTVTQRVGGSAVMSTASGDILIESSDATIEINSASGNAYIHHFTGRSANFKTMSGNIELTIPRGTHVDLDVKLLSGRLRLPDAEPREGPSERDMSIKAKSVSGDFTISRSDPAR
jgi:hypothetical protein